MVGACAQINPSASPEVSVTQIASANLVPKSPDCHLPILYVEPTRGFRKLAIVEGWGPEEQRSYLMTSVEKKACELGADSLLVVSDTAQITTKLVYDPANEEPGSRGNASLSDSKGHEIIQKEHVATIGEKGHSGYYIEAYALMSTDTNK
jgi:hypothetical protein